MIEPAPNVDKEEGGVGHEQAATGRSELPPVSQIGLVTRATFPRQHRSISRRVAMDRQLPGARGPALAHDLQRGSVNGARSRVWLCGLDQRQGCRVALRVDPILGRVGGGVDLGVDREVAIAAHRGEHGLEHLVRVEAVHDLVQGARDGVGAARVCAEDDGHQSGTQRLVLRGVGPCVCWQAERAWLGLGLGLGLMLGLMLGLGCVCWQAERALREREHRACGLDRHAVA